MTTLTPYAKAMKKIVKQELDWLGGTVKVMLLDSTYSPDRLVDEFIDDVSGSEVSGTGYTAGGYTLTGRAWDEDPDQIRAVSDDLAETGVTLAGVRYAIVYKDTGTPSTSDMFVFIDYINDQSVTAGDLNLFLPVNGFFYMQA